MKEPAQNVLSFAIHGRRDSCKNVSGMIWGEALRILSVLEHHQLRSRRSSAQQLEEIWQKAQQFRMMVSS